jgi:hypothetical protein
MLVKHPDVVVRLFTDALSTQGRLEAIRSRFWNQSYLPAPGELANLWRERHHLQFSEEAILALTAGEMANGNIRLRPWLMTVDKDELESIVVLAIVNGLYLIGRAERLGTNSSPIRGALACTLMTAMVRLPFDRVWELIEESWSWVDGEPPPPEMQRDAVQVIADRMALELADFCPSGCERVSSEVHFLSERESRYWWKRFRLPDDETYKAEARLESSWLVFVKPDKPCRIGLDVAGGAGCPLIDYDSTTPVSRKLMQAFKTVLFNELQRATADRQVEK